MDFADANSGVIFSVGESTYTGFSLTHENPFPISSDYTVEAFLDGELLGVYPFEVVPPAEAIPSEITEMVLAEGADDDYNPINPTTMFAPDQEVYLVGYGTFGLMTGIQVDWYVHGELAEEGTRSLIFEENVEDSGIVFFFVPEGGWPVGEHEAVLTMDGVEVGTYAFVVE